MLQQLEQRSTYTTQLAAWQARQHLEGRPSAHWLFLLSTPALAHACSSSPILLSALADGAQRITPLTARLCREAAMAPAAVGQHLCVATPLGPPRHRAPSRARRMLALLASAAAAWAPVLLACVLSDTRHTCVLVGMALALGAAVVDCIVAWSLHKAGLCKVWVRPWQTACCIVYGVLLLTTQIPRPRRVAVRWLYAASLGGLLLASAVRVRIGCGNASYAAQNSFRCW